VSELLERRRKRTNNKLRIGEETEGLLYSTVSGGEGGSIVNSLMNGNNPPYIGLECDLPFVGASDFSVLVIQIHFFIQYGLGVVKGSTRNIGRRRV